MPRQLLLLRLEHVLRVQGIIRRERTVVSYCTSSVPLNVAPLPPAMTDGPKWDPTTPTATTVPLVRLFVANVPASQFAAASSKPANKSMFEDDRINFRHLNYDDPQSLVAGLRGVENCLFVSTGSNRRGEQHSNVVHATRDAGVKHVCVVHLP